MESSTLRIVRKMRTVPMLFTSRLRKACRGPWQMLALLLLAWCGASPRGAAQQPPQNMLQPPVPQQSPLVPPASTVQPARGPLLPPVPQRDPRPAVGPEAVSAFVKDLTNTDTIFEVFLGQGRI